MVACAEIAASPPWTTLALLHCEAATGMVEDRLETPIDAFASPALLHEVTEAAKANKTDGRRHPGGPTSRIGPMGPSVSVQRGPGGLGTAVPQPERAAPEPTGPGPAVRGHPEARRDHQAVHAARVPSNRGQAVRER